METLNQRLNRLKTASITSVKLLEGLFVDITLKKGQLLSSLHHSFPILHYIEKGLLKGFSVVENVEYTSWLADEGFIPPIGGVFTTSSYPEFIQVLAPTTAWCLNLAKAEALAQKEPLMYRILLEIYEENLQKAKEREMLLKIPDAFLRFSKFMEQHEKLAYKVNNELLASLLRMNNKHLSKIKRRYAKSK